MLLVVLLLLLYIVVYIVKFSCCIYVVYIVKFLTEFCEIRIFLAMMVWQDATPLLQAA